MLASKYNRDIQIAASVVHAQGPRKEDEEEEGEEGEGKEDQEDILHFYENEDKN